MKTFLNTFFGLILNVVFRMAMLTQNTIGFVIAQIGIAITGPIVSKKLTDMKTWSVNFLFHRRQEYCEVAPLPAEEECPSGHRIGFIHNDGSIW